MAEKRYKVGEDYYNIPDTEAQNFLADFPDAVEVQQFDVEGEVYNIPVDKVGDFTTDMPKAVPLKKKEVSEPPAQPSIETIQEEFRGVSVKPAEYAEQPSEAPSPSLSPVDEKVEQYYTERGWPSPTKKFASWDAGIASISNEVEQGKISVDDAQARVNALAKTIGVNYDPSTGITSLAPEEEEIYNTQKLRAYQETVKEKAAQEKEGFFKDLLDNLNIGSYGVMTSPIRAMAVSERLANGMIGLVDKKKKLSSTYWQDKAATEAAMMDTWRNNNIRYDGTIAEMIQSGDMAGAAGQTAMALAENIPMLSTLVLGNAAGATKASLGFMGFDKGADEYLRSTSDPNMTEFSRIVNFTVKALSEIVWENVGTVSILNSVKKGISEVGEQTMRDQLRKAYTPYLQKQLTILSKGISNANLEGASELATQLTDNIMDKALGRDVELGDNLIDSYIVGAAIGAGLSSPQIAAEYKGGKTAFMKQLTSMIPEELDFDRKVELANLLVESAQIKYNQGQKIPGADMVNKQRMDEIQTRVAEILGVPVEEAEAPAGEQKQTKVEEGPRDAESVGVKVEERGKQEAPGVVEGEEERLRVQRVAEDRVEAQPGEAVIVETEKGTRVIAAPFYDTKVNSIEEARQLRQSAPYKAHIQHIKDSAELLGVKIGNISENIGGFVNEKGDKIVEVSNTIMVDGTIDQAEELAAVLGATAPEVQEATIAAEYVAPDSPNHNADELAVRVDNIDGAIQALKDADLYEFTIDETNGVVTVLDFDKGTNLEFDKRFTNFVKALKNNNVTYGKEKRTAVDSTRYITADGRGAILERVKGDAIRSEQGGTGFRSLLEEAIRRNEEFRGRAATKVAEPAPAAEKPAGEQKPAPKPKVPESVQKQIEAVTKSLNLSFPDVKVIVGENLGETREMLYDALVESGTSEKKARELADGFTDLDAGQSIFKNGKPVAVVINKAAANTRTAGHEMWEVILNSAFQQDPVKLASFVEAIDKGLRDSGYEDIADQLGEFVSSYEGEIQFSEYMAELGGYLTQSGIDITNLSAKEKTLLEHIKDIINKFAKALTGSEVFLKDATPENIMDFMVTISEKISKGEDVSKFLVEGQAPPNAEGLNAMRQSVSIMTGEKTLKKFGLSPGKNKTRVVAEALEAWARKQYGMIARDDRSTQALRKISKWMAIEVKYWDALKKENSGKGWYGKLYQKGMDKMSEIFPELKTDPNARAMFTMLMAITSDGQKVLRNFQLASEAYDVYRKTGKVPISLPAMRNASIKNNLKNINDLLVSYNGDVAKINKELLRVSSIKNINIDRKMRGLDPLETSWPVDFEAPFASSVFGPKLGMFFSNLSGVENYPTLDRWWSRTFNRYRGTLIPSIAKGVNTKGERIGIDRVKELLGNPSMTDEETLLAAKTYRDSYEKKGYKNGTELEVAANTLYKTAYDNINDAPFNKTDRAFMYEAISMASRQLNKEGYKLSIADIQAMLWYYEKNLYKKLGVAANIEGVSYEDAADETIRKYKKANNSFNYTIKKNEDAPLIEEEDAAIEKDELVSRSQRIEIPSEESDEAKRFKSHIRKLVRQAHGIKSEKAEQKKIDEAYKIGKAEEALIREIEEKGTKAQKQRLKDEYKQISKFISRAIKTAKFATKLSKTQARMLVNEARKVTNLDSLQDFFKILDRVVDNTQYAATMANAVKMRKAIMKRAKDASVYGEYLPKVQDFATIPMRVRDFSIEDLYKYNKIAAQLLQGKVPIEGLKAMTAYVPPIISGTKTSGLAADIDKIKDEEDLDGVIKAIEEIEIATAADYRMVARLTERVKEHLSALPFDEEVLQGMQDRLDALEAKIETRAKEIEEEIEEEKKMVIEEAKEVASTITRDNFEDIYDQEWDAVMEFKNISNDRLQAMSLKEVMLYNDIMNGLADGFINRYMYEFNRKANTKAMTDIEAPIREHIEGKYQMIAEFAERIAKIPGMKRLADWMAPLSRMDARDITSMMNLGKKVNIGQRFLGMYEKGKNIVFEKIMAPLYKAASAARNDMDGALASYWKAANKVSDETRAQIGIIMSEIDFRSRPIVIDGKEYTWDTLPKEEKKDRIAYAIENSKLHPDLMKKYAKVYETLLKDEDGNIDIGANLTKLLKDKNVSNYYNTVREIIDYFKPMAKISTVKRGEFWEEYDGYFPAFVIEDPKGRAVPPSDPKTLEDIIPPFKAIRKRARSTYQRTNERYVVDYDIDAVIGKYVADISRDYHIADALGTITSALDNMRVKTPSKTASNFFEALRGSIMDAARVELVDRASGVWLHNFIDAWRTAKLAKLHRPLIEATTNAMRYMMVHGKEIEELGIFDKRWKEVFEKIESPMMLKLSRWREQPAYDPKKGFLRRAAETLYTFADSTVGRAVYINEFSIAFKKETGKKFNVDKFIEDEQYRIDNKEAISAADAQAISTIEMMLGAQSWATAPSRHKYIPFTRGGAVSRKSQLAANLGFMQTFNFYETQEALNALLTVLRPGVSGEAKARAARRISTFMLTNYIYMASMRLAGTLIAGMFGDEDDLKEEIAEFWSWDYQKKMALGSVTSLGMGRYGNVMRTIIGLSLGMFEPADKSRLKGVYEVAAETSNLALNARPIDPRGQVSRARAVQGLGFLYADIAAAVLVSGSDFKTMMEKVRKEGIGSLSPEERESWMAMSAVNNTFMLLAPNIVSPQIQMLIDSKLKDVRPSYVVEPDKKARTIDGADLLDVYDLEGLPGMTVRKVTVTSSGENGEDARVLTDVELKKLEKKAEEKLNKYIGEYVMENRAQLSVDKNNRTLAEMHADKVEKDVKALWSEAKANAKLETLEYKDAQGMGTFQRAAEVDALPRPISSVMRSGENKLEDKNLAKKVNDAYVKEYLRLFKQQYPGDISVRRAQRKKGESGKSEFDKWQTDAMSEARKTAVDKYIPGTED